MVSLPLLIWGLMMIALSVGCAHDHWGQNVDDGVRKSTLHVLDGNSKMVPLPPADVGLCPYIAE
jgi:hypothetical protein